MAFPKVLALAVAGLSCLVARAETPDFSMKFRGFAGSKTEVGVRNGLGIGFNVGIPLPMANKAKVDVELGYLYFTGKPYTGPIATNAYGSVINPEGGAGASANFQKTNVQGFAVRAMYSQPFLTEGLRWQAGLSVNRLKSRMDAIGDIRTSGGSQIGGWTFSPEKSGTTLSPVVGVNYQFNEAGGLELNLMYVTYKQVTLTPTFAATVQTPATQTVLPVVGSKNVNTLKLEFAYVFRF